MVREERGDRSFYQVRHRGGLQPPRRGGRAEGGDSWGQGGHQREGERARARAEGEHCRELRRGGGEGGEGKTKKNRENQENQKKNVHSS